MLQRQTKILVTSHVHTEKLIFILIRPLEFERSLQIFNTSEEMTEIRWNYTRMNLHLRHAYSHSHHAHSSSHHPLKTLPKFVRQRPAYQIFRWQHQWSQCHFNRRREWQSFNSVLKSRTSCQNFIREYGNKFLWSATFIHGTREVKSHENTWELFFSNT